LPDDQGNRQRERKTAKTSHAAEWRRFGEAAHQKEGNQCRLVDRAEAANLDNGFAQPEQKQRDKNETAGKQHLKKHIVSMRRCME
jgi:hypothetical protein